jgi:trigger factor
MTAEPQTVQVEQISDIKRQLMIVVPSGEVAAELDRAYKNLGKRVKIKGFRPGKAPRAILEMYYKKQVDQEVADTLVRRFLDEALRQNSLVAVGLNWPEPLPPLVSGEDFRFKVEVEVPPEFTAENYLGLTLEDPGAEVTEAEVDERLEEIRRNNAMLEPVRENRGVREGDLVILDYQGYFAGEALPEGRGENVYLEVGSGKFNEDFEKQLLGLTPGAVSRFAVQLPPDFFNPLLAGKVIEFEVRVHEIKEAVVPELDDAFAQSLGGNFQTVADLREAVRDSIIKSKERRRRGQLEEQILEALVKRHNFETPPALIRQEQEFLLRDQLQVMQAGGLKLEGLDLERMLERLKPKAERRVRVRLILEKIASQEGITLSDEELDEGLHQIARQLRRPVDEVRKSYEENRLLEGLKRELRDEKVMQFLLDHATLVPASGPPEQEQK